MNATAPLSAYDYEVAARDAGYVLKLNTVVNPGYYCILAGDRDDSPETFNFPLEAWKHVCERDGIGPYNQEAAVRDWLEGAEYEALLEEVAQRGLPYRDDSRAPELRDILMESIKRDMPAFCKAHDLGPEKRVYKVRRMATIRGCSIEEIEAVSLQAAIAQAKSENFSDYRYTPEDGIEGDEILFIADGEDEGDEFEFNCRPPGEPFSWAARDLVKEIAKLTSSNPEFAHFIARAKGICEQGE